MKAFTTILTTMLCCLLITATSTNGMLKTSSTTRGQHDKDTAKNNNTRPVASFASYKSNTDNLPDNNRYFFTSNAVTKVSLGSSKQGRQIEAWYFPGTSSKRALVIGGVHGSELSSVEVAMELVKQLQNGAPPFYSVIIIPCLFPDNSAAALRDPARIGSTDNLGRYTNPQSVDPNRQMPTPGKLYINTKPVDHLEREIEIENRIMLSLINEYRPERIVNLHAIRDKAHAGIYADPRTDAAGYALGFEEDSLLAIAMAKYIHDNDGYVPGNNLCGRACALYYKDPAPAAKGLYQKRNYTGSALLNNRGGGVSLGTWATTAVRNIEDPQYDRDAIYLITVEFPGSKRPVDYADGKQQAFFQQQVKLYASAISKIFLHSVTELSLIASN